MELIRGQKVKLSDITSSLSVEVGVAIAPAAGQTIDISLFGLDANGKLSDDRYFIFYNQKASPCGSLRSTGANQGFGEVFAVDLTRLPSTIKRLVFVATLDGQGTMSAIGRSRVEIRAQGASGCFNFSGQDFGNEKAVMMAELYFKDMWRFAAVGQGFAGGLSALLAHFGGEETSAPAAPPVAPAAPPVNIPASALNPPNVSVNVSVVHPPVAPAPPPPVAVPDLPKVSLSKVSLDKRGSSQKVELRKGGGQQPIWVNLNWNKPEKKGFFSFGSKEPADLDLGCMYRLVDGTRGVVQALGNSFGSRNSAPYIFLDKDDRTGAASDGENMHIYRPDLIELVVVFAMIYEGTDNFSTVGGRLTLKDDKGNEILMPLNNPDARKSFCAVASIRQQGGTLSVTKDELYFTDAEACDHHYGFGFRWRAGSK